MEPIRCVRLGCYGLFVDGPFGHLWYKILDRSVEPDNPNGLKVLNPGGPCFTESSVEGLCDRKTYNRKYISHGIPRHDCRCY